MFGAHRATRCDKGWAGRRVQSEAQVPDVGSLHDLPLFARVVKTGAGSQHTQSMGCTHRAAIDTGRLAIPRPHVSHVSGQRGDLYGGETANDSKSIDQSVGRRAKSVPP